MNNNDLAYCGLDCIECKKRFANIRRILNELEEAFEKVNMPEMAKAIPFMHSRYKGYQKLALFFKQECPGCRSNGGNPFCGIRKCASKKGYKTCAECATGLCSKFKMLFKVHHDNEIQNAIEQLKKESMQSTTGLYSQKGV